MMDVELRSWIKKFICSSTVSPIQKEFVVFKKIIHQDKDGNTLCWIIDGDSLIEAVISFPAICAFQERRRKNLWSLIGCFLVLEDYCMQLHKNSMWVLYISRFDSAGNRDNRKRNCEHFSNDVAVYAVLRQREDIIKAHSSVSTYQSKLSHSRLKSLSSQAPPPRIAFTQTNRRDGIRCVIAHYNPFTLRAPSPRIESASVFGQYNPFSLMASPPRIETQTCRRNDSHSVFGHYNCVEKIKSGKLNGEKKHVEDKSTNQLKNLNNILKEEPGYEIQAVTEESRPPSFGVLLQETCRETGMVDERNVFFENVNGNELTQETQENWGETPVQNIFSQQNESEVCHGDWGETPLQNLQTQQDDSIHASCDSQSQNVQHQADMQNRTSTSLQSQQESEVCHGDWGETPLHNLQTQQDDSIHPSCDSQSEDLTPHNSQPQVDLQYQNSTSLQTLQESEIPHEDGQAWGETPLNDIQTQKDSNTNTFQDSQAADTSQNLHNLETCESQISESISQIHPQNQNSLSLQASHEQPSEELREILERSHEGDCNERQAHGKIEALKKSCKQFSIHLDDIQSMKMESTSHSQPLQMQSMKVSIDLRKLNNSFNLPKTSSSNTRSCKNPYNMLTKTLSDTRSNGYPYQFRKRKILQPDNKGKPSKIMKPSTVISDSCKSLLQCDLNEKTGREGHLFEKLIAQSLIPIENEDDNNVNNCSDVSTTNREIGASETNTSSSIIHEQSVQLLDVSHEQQKNNKASEECSNESNIILENVHVSSSQTDCQDGCQNDNNQKSSNEHLLSIETNEDANRYNNRLPDSLEEDITIAMKVYKMMEGESIEKPSVRNKDFVFNENKNVEFMHEENDEDDSDVSSVYDRENIERLSTDTKQTEENPVKRQSLDVIVARTPSNSSDDMSDEFYECLSSVSPMNSSIVARNSVDHPEQINDFPQEIFLTPALPKEKDAVERTTGKNYINATGTQENKIDHCQKVVTNYSCTQKSNSDLTTTLEVFFQKPTSCRKCSDETTPRDNYADKTVSGDQNADKTVSGDQNANETVSGDENADKTISGDQNVGEIISGDQNADKTISGNENANETFSGDQNAGEAVSKGINTLSNTGLQPASTTRTFNSFFKNVCPMVGWTPDEGYDHINNESNENREDSFIEMVQRDWLKNLTKL